MHRPHFGSVEVRERLVDAVSLLLRRRGAAGALRLRRVRLAAIAGGEAEDDWSAALRVGDAVERAEALSAVPLAPLWERDLLPAAGAAAGAGNCCGGAAAAAGEGDGANGCGVDGSVGEAAGGAAAEPGAVVCTQAAVHRPALDDDRLWQCVIGVLVERALGAWLLLGAHWRRRMPAE
eukprot:gene2692-4532_t